MHMMDTHDELMIAMLDTPSGRLVAMSITYPSASTLAPFVAL